MHGKKTMKHLAQIIRRTQPMAGCGYRPAAEAPRRKKPFAMHCKSQPGIPPKLLAYQVNGYWFVFTLPMWQQYTGTNKDTIAKRLDGGKPVGQALGFEKLERKKYAA